MRHADPVYHCTRCEDTGFVRDMECPGDGRCAVGHCGQPGHVSYAHGYTRKCHCRADNPVLKAQRDRLKLNAAKEKHERSHPR